jgi:hypothetical protein
LAPGAGKTTLVASWLDARNIKGIWYQVDWGVKLPSSCRGSTDAWRTG